ncbi:MAG: DUF2520 domain-containing protein [Anaerolineae bacterium]|nr:DUF2520 domain-containing protein [Anaerolineae bacterium]
MQQPTLGFVGAGKVGHTLARLWYARGFRVLAVYSRTPEHEQRLAHRVEADVARSPAAVIQNADLTLLTVPDDAIHAVVGEMVYATSKMDGNRSKAVVHTSGALDMAVLSPLSKLGLMTGSIHPAFPFADVETAVDRLPGATFGIEADSDILRAWLGGLVKALNGRIFPIPSGGKAVYHSAFVFTSNYAVTLYAIAERLLISLGAEREVADNALNGLLGGTVANLERRGVPDALTGPLVRGDVDTIRLHLEALGRVDASLAELYRRLARASLPLLEARNIDTTLVEQILNRDSNHASDHS